LFSLSIEVSKEEWDEDIGTAADEDYEPSFNVTIGYVCFWNKG